MIGILTYPRGLGLPFADSEIRELELVGKLRDRIKRFIGASLTGNTEGAFSKYFNKQSEFVINPLVLSILQTVTSMSIGSTPTSMQHQVDSGADLLVVMLMSGANVDCSSVTANGVNLTRAYGYFASYAHSSVWYLRNPTVGLNTIVSNWGGSPSGFITCVNIIGSKASPMRAGVGDANASQTLGVVAGDIAIEAFKNNNPLTPTDGQTVLSGAGGGLVASYKVITASGNETFSWSGTIASPSHTTAIIAGS